MSQQIRQIQHTDADIVVIGDYRISVAPGHNVLKSSFKEVDDYLKKNFGIADGTQAAMSFVNSFYGVPECDSMTLSHWRLFQIALVTYILGKTKRSMSVHFAGGRIHYDLFKSRGYNEIYPEMFKMMWQREPTVAKVATSYLEVTWIMGNGRPAEIEDKSDDDFKVKYSVPLKLSVSKPSVSFNFD